MRDPTRNRRADAVLVLVLVLECIGAFAMAARDGGVFEQLGSTLALGAALTVALGKRPRAAYVAAGWFALVALLACFSGAHLAPVAIFARAARYAVPLAIALPGHATPILRVAASATFAGHGIEALDLEPLFVAYLQHSVGLLGCALPTATAHVLLRMIGSIDLVLAVALWLPRPAGFAARYMFFWGTLTALVRTVYAGPVGLADTLIRAANGGAPLALWLRTRTRA